VAEYNFLARALSNWTKEIQAPIVLGKQKNTGYCILILIFLLVFEDNFQVHALGGLCSAEEFNAGILRYEFVELIFGLYMEGLIFGMLR